jgi:para-nitrobenzyl esterase
MMGMPMAEGLFRRTIAQSVPGGCYTPALAADIAKVLAGRLGCGHEAASLAEIGWPGYHADQGLTRLLEVNPRTKPYPEEASRRIWAGHDPGPFD